MGISALLRTPARVESSERRQLLSGGSGAEASIGASFEGIDFGSSGFIPPDTMGAVGPDHIVEIINGGYRVWDKSGNELASSSLNAFWNSTGAGYDGKYAFDPRILYDPNAQRWFASSVDNAGGLNNILFAVSKTSNPLDGWSGFKLDGDSDDTAWADFPQMGFDNDGVYITANMFLVGGGYEDVNMWILPKVDLLATIPSVGRMSMLESIRNSTGFAAQPASYDEATDPESSFPPRFFSDASNQGVYVSELTGDIFSPGVTYLGFTDTLNRSSPPLARQPDGSRTLDSGGSRIRSRVTYESGSYWLVQGTAGSNANAALRLVEIDATSRVAVQDQLVEDLGGDYICGSIAVTRDEDVVLGFTRSGPGAGEFASAAFIVGETSGGVTTFGDVQIARAGAGNYSRETGGRNRWGDYSATVLDPTQPGHVWTFQEFAVSTDNWSTQITEIVLPDPLDFIEGEFTFEQSQTLVISFDASLDDTFSAADLVLQNLTLDTLVDTSSFIVNVVGSTLLLTANSILLDGNYIATLPAGTVEDVHGNALAGDVAIKFFVLAGDTDRDRDVDFFDFLKLRSNYGTSGNLFSDGDLDYDTDVDFFDFLILRGNYGVTLPPPGGSGSLFADDQGSGGDGNVTRVLYSAAGRLNAQTL